MQAGLAWPTAARGGATRASTALISHDSFSDALTKCLPKDTHSRHTLVLLGVTPSTGPTTTQLNADSTNDHLRFLDASTSLHTSRGSQRL